jgi:hypothetical protein
MMLSEISLSLSLSVSLSLSPFPCVFLWWCAEVCFVFYLLKAAVDWTDAPREKLITGTKKQQQKTNKKVAKPRETTLHSSSAEWQQIRWALSAQKIRSDTEAA